MKCFDVMFLWLAGHFTATTHLYFTKLQGIIWSLADIVLVFFLLKMVNVARAHVKKKRVTIRFLFLWLSAAITPLLIFAGTSGEFFILESIICGIQFVILAVTVITERKVLLHFVQQHLPLKTNPNLNE